MEPVAVFSDSVATDQEDVPFPCKGCGEVGPFCFVFPSEHTACLNRSYTDKTSLALIDSRRRESFRTG